MIEKKRDKKPNPEKPDPRRDKAVEKENKWGRNPTPMGERPPPTPNPWKPKTKSN